MIYNNISSLFINVKKIQIKIINFIIKLSSLFYYNSSFKQNVLICYSEENDKKYKQSINHPINYSVNHTINQIINLPINKYNIHYNYCRNKYHSAYKKFYDKYPCVNNCKYKCNCDWGWFIDFNA
jgi:hypothetical protein